MDEAVFSEKVMGLISSITTPLLASLILIDGLINEQIHESEEYGKILLIDEQIQSSIEYLLQLRTLSLNQISRNLINNKSHNNKNGLKEFLMGICIGVNMFVMVLEIYKLKPIYSLNF